jgi:hypothetical protein
LQVRETDHNVCGLDEGITDSIAVRQGGLQRGSDPRYRANRSVDGSELVGFAWPGFNSVVTAFCSAE